MPHTGCLWVKCVLLLVLILAAFASPAFADLINLELTVSYFPPADFPADSHFVGTASFYLDVRGGNGPQPVDSPALIFLDVFERTVSAVEDPSLVDSCVVDGSCGVDTSVRGKAGGFTVFAFPSNVDFPPLERGLAPIIPIGSLAPTDPCRDGPGNPCRQTGWLVAYDSGPVVVGSWDVTMSAVPEPSGMALLGISILLVMRSERSRRRAGQQVRRSQG
jgi:hypothetical protein